jgi:hypothetical protein
LDRAIERLKKNEWALLLDWRAAPTVNNPAFERVLQKCGARSFSGFEAVAFLMNSIVGKVQAERLNPGWKAFLTDTEAVSHLRALSLTGRK